MKAVLLSIRPKWCELIASGEKTVEVRKTRPKIPVPFKCYIYCTKPKMVTKYVFKPEDYPEYMRPEKTVFCKVPDASSPFCSEVNGNGKVIGEFVCDEIKTYPADDFVGAEDLDGTIITEPKDGVFAYWIPEEKETCLPYEKILAYGNGKTLYGWHISDLKVYDKPRELSEFGRGCDAEHTNEIHCRDCKKLVSFDDCCEVMCKPLNRPPQSWCYVEELP